MFLKFMSMNTKALTIRFHVDGAATDGKQRIGGDYILDRPVLPMF
jgi:hypothetical protein